MNSSNPGLGLGGLGGLGGVGGVGGLGGLCRRSSRAAGRSSSSPCMPDSGSAAAAAAGGPPFAKRPRAGSNTSNGSGSVLSFGLRSSSSNGGPSSGGASGGASGSVSSAPVSLSPPPDLSALPLPLNLSPVHTGIAGLAEEEDNGILTTDTLDVMPATVVSSTSSNGSTTDSQAAVSKVDSEIDTAGGGGESPTRGLQLLSPFDTDEPSPLQIKEEVSMASPLSNGHHNAPSFVTGDDDPTITDDKLILVVTSDNADLLDNSGYVTLQSIGPDGEPSLITVPSSSLAQLAQVTAVDPAIGGAVVSTTTNSSPPVNVFSPTNGGDPSSPCSVLTADVTELKVKSAPSLASDSSSSAVDGLVTSSQDQQMEPYTDVYTGEVLHVCPADCSFYCRSADGMREHLAGKHSINIPAHKLTPVVFDSVSNVSLKCSHCSEQCFRDVILTYRGMNPNSNNKITGGNSASSSKKIVKRTVRQCKRCGLESSTKSSMIQFNAHVAKCHNNGPSVSSNSTSSLLLSNGGSTPSPPLGKSSHLQSATFSSSSVSRAATSRPIKGLKGPRTGANAGQQPDEGSGRVQCPICGVELGGSTAGGGDLNAHIRAFHSMSKPTTTTTQVPTSSLIQFICPKCGEVFSSHSDLARHQDTSHGERIKYECHKCKFISDDLRTWNSHFSSCSSTSSPNSTHGQNGIIGRSQFSTPNRKSAPSVGFGSSSSSSSPASSWATNSTNSNYTASTKKSANKQQYLVNSSNPTLANPQCPRCDFQTPDINAWNDHYLNCTLKYSK